MPSGKRETERKGNTPVNTGPLPNSDGRANNLVEEADETARGSGPGENTATNSEVPMFATCEDSEIKTCQ
ncbi:hypothetical protein T08_13870 [Trichinella sp. T8]|nr:hypothetical protein T08_13870 [Trichinella sp. T8]